MSTRSFVNIFEDGEPLITIYRQCDGYPEGLGRDLYRFLKGRVVGNGIGSDAVWQPFSNGLHDLAAQLVEYLKKDSQLGNVYVYPTIKMTKMKPAKLDEIMELVNAAKASGDDCEPLSARAMRMAIRKNELEAKIDERPGDAALKGKLAALTHEIAEMVTEDAAFMKLYGKIAESAAGDGAGFDYRIGYDGKGKLAIMKPERMPETEMAKKFCKDCWTEYGYDIHYDSKSNKLKIRVFDHAGKPLFEGSPDDMAAKFGFDPKDTLEEKIAKDAEGYAAGNWVAENIPFKDLEKAANAYRECGQSMGFMDFIETPQNPVPELFEIQAQGLNRDNYFHAYRRVSWDAVCGAIEDWAAFVNPEKMPLGEWLMKEAGLDISRMPKTEEKQKSKAGAKPKM